MKLKIQRLWGLGIVLTAVITAPVYSQIGCEYPPFTSCNNPTPATNVNGDTNNGSWVHYSSTWGVISQWYLSTGAVAPGGVGTISGSVRVPSPAAGCPDVYYTASGTISPSQQTDGTRGSTSFSWTASNPSPSGSCGGYTPVSSMNHSGSILNKSIDFASGTWTRSDGQSGSLTLRRFYVEPINETTIGDGFGVTLGLTTTMARFRQVLTKDPNDPPDPNSNIFQGRQVFETSGGLVTDNCYDRSGGLYPGGRFAIKGSVWNVGYASTFSGNTWGWDTIGWPPAGVNWYRTNLAPSQFPCAAVIPQNMNIVVNGDTGGNIVYKSLYLQAVIDLTSLQVVRDNVTQVSQQ